MTHARSGLAGQQRRAQFLWGWALVLPTVAGLIILNIWPMIRTIFESFYKAGDFGLSQTFVGLKNYQMAFQDPRVLKSLRNALLYMLMEVPVSIFLALLLAVFLNSKIRGRSFYRTLFFLPMVTAPAVVAMIWNWLYNANYGLINHIIGHRIYWISDPKLALMSIAIVGVWSILGYNMVILLSGLQEIPKDFYEAADIDGAGFWRQLFQITIPLVSPTLFFVLVTRVIGALQVFDVIYMIMTRDNPALESVQSPIYLFYRFAFEEKQRGYGATVVVMLLVITILITIAQQLLQKRWVIYE
ncbi:MAG: sugar ABC transporter permease [Eubacteriales bacterium]|nr:sugar ABC transporter permease [Eubacteriales bacterium]